MKKSKQKLTIKQKKLAKAKIEGKTHLQAYEAAGYSITGNKNVDNTNAVRAVNKPHIQQAINDALELHGATPEWAVSQLMKVAAQDEELGAKRLANMNLIELHGWNKSERPGLQLEIKNAFFSARRTDDEPTD